MSSIIPRSRVLALSVLVGGLSSVASAFTPISENFTSGFGAFNPVSYDGTATPGAGGLALVTSSTTDYSNASIRSATGDLFWGATGATYTVQFGADAFTLSDSGKEANVRLFLGGNSPGFGYDVLAANGIWVMLRHTAAGNYDLFLRTKIGAEGEDWYSAPSDLYVANIGNPGGKSLSLTLQEVGLNTEYTIQYTGLAPQSFTRSSIAGQFDTDTQLVVGLYNGSVSPLTFSGVITEVSVAAPIPEPGTSALGAALVAAGGVALRRRRRMIAA